MAETIYASLTTGNTYYAKPAPIVAAPWATDVETMTENATVNGWYASSSIAAPADVYSIFEQAGGSPADSDTLIGGIQMNLSSAGASSNLVTETTIIEAA